MPRWKCNACGGVYNDTTDTGALYHHNCGPLPPDAHGVERERPNRRQENIKLQGREPTGDIVAEGAGVTPMDGQAEVEPAWITRMKAGKK